MKDYISLFLLNFIEYMAIILLIICMSLLINKYTHNNVSSEDYNTCIKEVE